MGPLKAAQLRYDHGAWTLHWADRNGPWLAYPRLEPSPHLDDLLAEIDRDPLALHLAVVIRMRWCAHPRRC